MQSKTNFISEKASLNESSKRITVIIPVLNMGDKITYCLEAVFNQTYMPYEVIVVDGHSKDDTVANAQKFETRVLYEDYHTRAGANQVGLEASKGDYIAFTDADCIPDPDWLKNLLSELEDGIVGVGGSVHNIGDSLWQKSINLSQDTFLGAANSIQGRVYKKNKYVNSISGCSCLYRKRDLVKVGGFRTDLRTAEDTELNKRLLTLGKLLYVPNAIMIHKHGRGLADFSKRMRQYGAGRATSLLFDLQVFPPIIALMVLASAFIQIELFFYSILLYLLIICFYTFLIFIKNPSPLYLLTIPVTYFVEHVSYTVGFWNGIIKKVKVW
jgi:GT2 family glycosyltransferase